jgi:hypothetical protein
MTGPHVSTALHSSLRFSLAFHSELQNRSWLEGNCYGQRSDLHGRGKIPSLQQNPTSHRHVDPTLGAGIDTSTTPLFSHNAGDTLRLDSWQNCWLRCRQPHDGRRSAWRRHRWQPTQPALRASGSGTTHTSTMWLKPGSATSLPRKRRDPLPRLLALTQKTVVTQRRVGGASNHGEQISAVAPMPAGSPLCVDTLAPFRHSGNKLAKKKAFS